MGWTGCHATHYDKRGNIDRRAECDEIISGETERTMWEVLKSSMVGAVYYAAIRRTDKETGENYVFGCVCLTSVDNKNYCNFSYKDMDENMGPAESRCPLGILYLLSPTENEYALAWRQRCRDNAKNKNSLSRLPVGAVIEFERWNGETVRLEKRAPAYQFKAPWWKVCGENHYFQKNHIPQNFCVVEEAVAS